MASGFGGRYQGSVVDDASRALHGFLPDVNNPW